MKTQDPELALGIQLLITKALADYRAWWGVKAEDPAVKNMIEEFRVYAEGGNKYIRIVHESAGSRSAHCFVVAKDTAKFKRGDILKSATWNAPATNLKRGNVLTAARGNVLTGDLDCIRWTGAL